MSNYLCLSFVILKTEKCRSSMIPEMTDMEQTFIRSAITEVLPDLPEMTKDILEETLQSLGVETYEDFQFVNEADLLSALRPIQARKVLAAWKLRCMYTCDYFSTGCNQCPKWPA